MAMSTPGNRAWTRRWVIGLLAVVLGVLLSPRRVDASAFMIDLLVGSGGGGGGGGASGNDSSVLGLGTRLTAGVPSAVLGARPMAGTWSVDSPRRLDATDHTTTLNSATGVSNVAAGVQKMALHGQSALAVDLRVTSSLNTTSTV